MVPSSALLAHNTAVSRGIERDFVSKSSSPKEYVKNASIVVLGIWLRMSHVVRWSKLAGDNVRNAFDAAILVQSWCKVGASSARLFGETKED